MSSLDSLEIQQDLISPEELESEFIDFQPEPRYSQIAGMQMKWENSVAEALQLAGLVDPFQSDLPEGVVIPAVEATNWSKGQRSCDIRPRLVDKSSGIARLIDSGSMITAIAKGPGDKIDNTRKLIAVNGSEIKTYGVRKLVIKIGRKTYDIDAVVCDVKQDILGMDFLNKYKLSLVW